MIMQNPRLSFKSILVAVVLAATPVVAGVTSQVSATAVIPEYTELLPKCTNPSAATVPCHWPDPSNTDAPVVILLKCNPSAGITNYCYDITVNGAAAPATLGLTARMTAYKTHDASVSNAQYEAMFHLYQIPSGGSLSTSDVFGVGQRPRNQDGGSGKVDLSGVLAPTDVVKITAKFKMHKLPQYNVFIASNGMMTFALTGNDLTVTMEGSPARVAIESATQHIDFDTEKNDDPTKAWTDRCGIPSMKFVVCNVDRAESNPLIFYGRSSTMVNPPAADVPGPIWVSTNATYFHQPGVSFDSKGNPQLQLKFAAPHLLADGSTVNSGSFRTFLPAGLLAQWKIDMTQEALEKTLAASIRKNGVETVVERTFSISPEGVLVTLPNLTYSSPEVFITSISASSGQSANQVYQALLAGTSASGTSTSVTPTTKSIKKGSSAALATLIKPVSGNKNSWSVKGACKISGVRLVAVTKGKTCTLTLRQTNTKTKKTTSRSVTIKVT